MFKQYKNQIFEGLQTLPVAAPNTPVNPADANFVFDYYLLCDKLNSAVGPKFSKFYCSCKETFNHVGKPPRPESPNGSATSVSDAVTSNDNISGPLDQFNVTELVGLKFEILGKFYLAITNITFFLGLVLIVIISIFYFGNNDSKLVPNKWSIVLETFFASLKGMVKDQIGLAYEVYLPLIFSIFFFFLTGNLISNIPYSFAVNASGVVSIGYSLTFF